MTVPKIHGDVLTAANVIASCGMGLDRHIHRNEFLRFGVPAPDSHRGSPFLVQYERENTNLVVANIRTGPVTLENHDVEEMGVVIDHPYLVAAVLPTDQTPGS